VLVAKAKYIYAILHFDFCVPDYNARKRLAFLIRGRHGAVAGSSIGVCFWRRLQVPAAKAAGSRSPVPAINPIPAIPSWLLELNRAL
jgi:hypothetical protein